MLLNEEHIAGCSAIEISQRKLIYLADSSTAGSFKQFIRAAQQVHSSGVLSCTAGSLSGVLELHKGMINLSWHWWMKFFDPHNDVEQKWKCHFNLLKHIVDHGLK